MSRQLLDLAARMADTGGPDADLPVERWTPQYCGDIDIRIRRDGLWFHEGTPIGRPELVRLFASILIREGDQYYLITPVEKMRIVVDDVPFVAVTLDASSIGQPAQKLIFGTNLGDRLIAGPDRPLRFEVEEEGDGALVPYLPVRRGLDARIGRAVYYELMDLVETDGAGQMVLRSGGASFPLAAEQS